MLNSDSVEDVGLSERFIAGFVLDDAAISAATAAAAAGTTVNKFKLKLNRAQLNPDNLVKYEESHEVKTVSRRALNDNSIDVSFS